MDNKQISFVLSTIKKTGGNIWLATDWHMVRYDKETGLISKHPDFDEIIKNQIKTVQLTDAFIYLGDLVDDEVMDESYIKEIVCRLNGCFKVFIRGNNDTFADEVYKNKGYGFDEVVWGMVFQNILFSHTSVPCDAYDIYNVHGHIHRVGWNTEDIPYYHPCKRNVNICNMGIVNLSDLDLEKLSKKNTKYISGHQEKKGMSTMCQNMAKQLLSTLGE